MQLNIQRAHFNLLLSEISGHGMPEDLCHLVLFSHLWVLPIGRIQDPSEEDYADRKRSYPPHPNSLQIELKPKSEERSQSDSDEVEAEDVYLEHESTPYNPHDPRHANLKRFEHHDSYDNGKQFREMVNDLFVFGEESQPVVSVDQQFHYDCRRENKN